MYVKRSHTYITKHQGQAAKVLTRVRFSVLVDARAYAHARFGCPPSCVVLVDTMVLRIYASFSDGLGVVIDMFERQGHAPAAWVYIADRESSPYCSELSEFYSVQLSRLPHSPLL